MTKRANLGRRRFWLSADSRSTGASPFPSIEAIIDPSTRVSRIARGVERVAEEGVDCVPWEGCP